MVHRFARLVAVTTIAVLLVGACAEQEPGPAPDVEPPTPVVGLQDVEPEPTAPAPPPTPIADAHREVATRLIDAARSSDVGWERLTYLCDTIGPRLSGSRGLERAVDWATAQMEADGLDVVRKEPVKVPAWVRGEESATITSPRVQELQMLGLGNSVGTPAGGIEAEVVPVRTFDELTALGEAVRGKIVLYTHALPPYSAEGGSGYGGGSNFRVRGPSKASALGAVATMVRSVTATSLATPHTGMLAYDGTHPEVPAIAITIENCTMIERMIAAGETVRVRIEMEAHFGPEADSANVVGEIRGREKPDEIIVVGGHLDSWDVGTGAHDDGAPSMAVLEAMRLIKSLGLQPRRTIRAVLFTNEENGLRGARQYVGDHSAEMPNHVAAIEADSGMFAPQGVTNPKPRNEQQERQRARLIDIMTLLDPIDAGRVKDGGGGADIGQMAQLGVPQIGLWVEGSKYFDYHHTHADTLDKVDPAHVKDGAAALAVLVWTLAEMTERFRD